MIWGNYGLVYLTDLGFYAELVSGSQWDMTANQYQEVYRSVMEGMQFFAYKAKLSFAVAGRIVLNPGRYGNARDLGRVVREVARRCRLSPHGFSQAQYNEFLDMRLRANDPNLPQILNRSKYFYTSEVLAHARTDHHLVIRMLSDRTGANELGIGNPTLNYHMTDGASYFMIHGEEYTQARLGMNYTAIPGTTVEQKSGQPTVAGANTMNSDNEFSGGVSDGIATVGGFEYDRSHRYSTTIANKGYFLFDDVFAFLGNNINQTGRARGEIWTTLNQAERRTPITYDLGQGTNTISMGTNTQRNFANLNQIAWFHHDNIGYIIIPNGSVNLKLWAENRNGRWKDLDRSNNDNTLRSVNMFQLSINHDTNPQNGSYSYLVIPNVTARQTSTLAINLPVQIVKHTREAQVVFHYQDQVCEAILYDSNQSFSSPLGVNVESDKPAVLLMKMDTSRLYLSISDPLQKANQIKLTLNGEFLVPM